MARFGGARALAGGRVPPQLSAGEWTKLGDQSCTTLRPMDCSPAGGLQHARPLSSTVFWRLIKSMPITLVRKAEVKKAFNITSIPEGSENKFKDEGISDHL